MFAFVSFLDEDSNGTIDREELRKCLEKLQLHLKDEEIEDLFSSCDIDGSQGIQFNEFIVLLCLAYLLMTPSFSLDTVFTMSTNVYMLQFRSHIVSLLSMDFIVNHFVTRKARKSSISNTNHNIIKNSAN